MTRRPPAPPGGTPPPVEAELPGGQTLELVALAREICRRYRLEFPDEHARYGDAGISWCEHDNRHILHWTLMSLKGWVDLEGQLSWLARVLEAREFPLDRLARNLELAAVVAAEHGDPAPPELAQALRGGAVLVRSRVSFL